jgi:hypothetical protein
MRVEEWLIKNCKLEDWNRLEEKLSDCLWTNNVIDYMEKYAEAKNKKVNESLDSAISIICELCVRLNPHHKDCTSCPEVDDLRDSLK